MKTSGMTKPFELYLFIHLYLIHKSDLCYILKYFFVATCFHILKGIAGFRLKSSGMVCDVLPVRVTLNWWISCISHLFSFACLYY